MFCLNASLLYICIMAAYRIVDQMPKTSASNNAQSSTQKTTMANCTHGCRTMMVSGHLNVALFIFALFSAGLTVDPFLANTTTDKCFSLGRKTAGNELYL